jgi:hypothetical protein
MRRQVAKTPKEGERSTLNFQRSTFNLGEIAISRSILGEIGAGDFPIS